MGLNSIGDNIKTLKKYILQYNIDIEHFNYNKKGNIKKIKLCDVLVEKSSYNRNSLKKRLYKEGLKKKKCELCGQTEEWKGKKISLILDHKNGVNNDNRIDNLQIVCPNCNATLDTHCSKNGSKYNYNQVEECKKYCSCGKKMSKGSDKCLECYALSQRKVVRPEYDILIKEIKETGYTGTGRKYGVSDNAIRKWKKYYEK